MKNRQSHPVDGNLLSITLRSKTHGSIYDFNTKQFLRKLSFIHSNKWEQTTKETTKKKGVGAEFMV